MTTMPTEIHTKEGVQNTPDVRHEAMKRKLERDRKFKKAWREKKKAEDPKEWNRKNTEYMREYRRRKRIERGEYIPGACPVCGKETKRVKCVDARHEV